MAFDQPEQAHQQIDRWVDEYGDSLYSWALHKVRDEPAAQDIVQETFIAAFQKLHSFRGESSPKTWLIRILQNKIIDYFRRLTGPDPSARQLDSLEKWFDAEGTWKDEHRPLAWHQEENLLDDPEFEDVLNKCLDRLPASWRACLQLKYLESKESGEICQELNISASNYWQMIHRAKLQMRQCLDENWFLNPTL